MRIGRRKHSKIDALPDPIKDAVEEMMKANHTYAEIVDFIKAQGVEISIASVCRYASSLNATLSEIRMAQENFKAIAEEIAKYPQLDPAEGVLRLAAHQVLEAIQQTPKDALVKMGPDKLLRQANGLVRAATYKSKVDLTNKDILDAGFEQVKTLMFESLAKERPDLYAAVSKFLAEKSAEKSGGAA
jgi:hypothetical protein